MRVRCENVKAVVEHKEEGNYEGLRDFNAVYSCQDVDAVWAEDRNGGHVKVVEGSEVEKLSEVRLERGGEDNGCYAKVDEVDYQDGDGRKGRNEELVPPADVEEIVAYSEDGDGLEGEDC
jgi:hypothetical protein